jgi:hypothetical protein
MMLGRQGPDSQAIIHQIIREARQRGVSTGGGGDALDATTGPLTLANALGFRYIDLRSPPIVRDGNFFAGLLGVAPFGLFGNRPGYGLHAIAIYRLRGDFASLGSTIAHGIDPMGGHRFSRPLVDLVMPTRHAGAAMTGHIVIWR